MRRWLTGLVALAAALSASTAQAWSEPTHQVTGAIAWQDLKVRHPAELGELLNLIRQHQDYGKFQPFLAGLAPELQERGAFEVLGRWPDDIRGGPEDHPDWHFQLRVVSGRTWLWPFENGNAAFGFGTNYAKLANPCAPASERAKAIGWLIHIIGDIQQPLHAGHQMTEIFSATDRAGQLAFVKRPDGQVTDLHRFWDETLDKSGVRLPAGQDSWADALIALWPRERLTLELSREGEPQAVFASFLDESAELARLVGYQGTFLRATADPATAPMVTEAEQAQGIALTQRRIATGGYRIADLLARAIRDAKAATWTCPV
ncbi:MAG: hypothetical protein C0515_08470 [Novosphingobium sp.]|nr:hypothetical protein [Novosphingobium sp.]